MIECNMFALVNYKYIAIWLLIILLKINFRTFLATIQFFHHQNLESLMKLWDFRIISFKVTSKYLSKYYIEINSNQKYVIKGIKTTKLLDKEITRVTNGFNNND